MPVVNRRPRGERLVTRRAKCLRQIRHDAFKSRRSVGFGHMDIYTIRGEVLTPSNECTSGMPRVERPAAESDDEETDHEDAADSEEEKSAFEASRVNAEGYWDEQRHCERNEKPNDRGDNMFSRCVGSNTPCLKVIELTKDVVANKESSTKGTKTSVIASKMSVPIARGMTLPSR